MKLLSATVLLVAATAAFAAGNADSASPGTGPIVSLLDWKGELFVEGDVRQDSRTTGGFTSQEGHSLLREGVDLRGKGAVYHPNFLEWTLGLRLGASEESSTTSGGTGSGTGFGTLLGYDFSALLLRGKMVSARVFSSRAQDVQQRGFAPSVNVLTERTGGEVMLKGKFPMSLLAEQTHRFEQVEQRGDFDETAQHVRFLAADRRNPNWLTTLELDHLARDEKTTINTDAGGDTLRFTDVTDKLEVNNEYKFGPGKDKHSLRGQIYVWDEKGSFPRRIDRVEERLDLVHSKTFSTFYRGMLNVDQSDQQSETDTEAEIGFNQSIFKSLDITGRATLTNRSFDNGGKEDIAGVFLDATYHKRTAIGLYTSSLSLGRENTREAGGTTTRFIRDEVITFTFADPSKRLKRTNIDINSIVVHDPNHPAVVFARTIDYNIQMLGNITEIVRIDGGLIGPTDSVKVDYVIQVPGDYGYSTNQVGWRNRLELKNLPVALFADFRLRDELLNSGEDPGNLDRVRSYRVGADVRYKGLTGTVEHEQVTQLLSPPTIADRVRVDYSSRIARDTDLGVGAYAGMLRYINARQFGITDADFLRTAGAYGAITTRLSPQSLLRFRSEVVQTAGRENRTAFSNGATLEWKYGQLDFAVDARYEVFQQEDTSGQQGILHFSVKRRF